MAQIIRRNRRRDYRRTVPPLDVRLGSLDGFVSRDWSLGGLSAQGPVAELPVAEVVEGALRALDTDTPYVDFAGRIIRVDPTRDVLALTFSDLSPACFHLLERLLLRPVTTAPDVPDAHGLRCR